MVYLLGIDVGTTGTKSALFNEKGDLVDISSRSYGVIYPREGWVEQNPDDWWNVLVETVREVVSRNRCASDVVALSLSTQGGALVLLDKNFKPVYNAISWLDKRAQDVSDRLIRNIGVLEIYRTCGWPVVNGLNFPTIFWFKEKDFKTFKKAFYFASTVDYINYLLTGKFAIDYTNLALTMFLDLKKRDWSDRMLEIAGITRDDVPEILSSGKVIGTLKDDTAKTLGLNRDVKVISGAHDQYCASIGAGAVNVGDCVLSCGTAWVLLATSDRLLFSEDYLKKKHGIVSQVFPGLHPIEGKYGLMTSVPFGGISLSWFRDVMKPGTSFENLNDEAIKVSVGSDGLLFVPISTAGSGRGAFLGIDGIHKISQFTRAVFEGVSLVNNMHLEMIQNAGLKVKNLIMIGGGAKSTIWPQMVSDVCNVSVILPELKEAACAGAAILAGFGSGMWASIEEASERFVKNSSMVKPIDKNVAVYKDIYPRFLKILDSV